MQFVEDGADAELDKETVLLEEFVGTQLRPGSILQKRILLLIREIDHERAVAKRNRSRNTVAEKVKSSEVTLKDHEAADHTNTEFVDDTVLNSIAQQLLAADLRIALTAATFVVVVTHCLMINEKFVAVAEHGNAVPGFAPSLRELPKGMLLPPNWCEVPTAITLMYKHQLANGKQFTLSVVQMSGSTSIITVAQKGGASYSREVDSEQMVKTDSVTFELNEEFLRRHIGNFKGLKSQVKALLVQLLPGLAPVAPIEQPLSAVTGGAMDLPTSSSSSSSGWQPPYNIGREDLEPAVSGGRGAGLNPIAPGTGSLVGPDHPMFNPYAGGGHEDDFFPGGVIGGGATGGGYFGPPGSLPQPRFDPFGPFPGPGRGRGGRGSGGRGPPGVGPLHFPGGESNPDHLRPPGW